MSKSFVPQLFSSLAFSVHIIGIRLEFPLCSLYINHYIYKLPHLFTIFSISSSNFIMHPLFVALLVDIRLFFKSGTHRVLKSFFLILFLNYNIYHYSSQPSFHNNFFIIYKLNSTNALRINILKNLSLVCHM